MKLKALEEKCLKITSKCSHIFKFPGKTVYMKLMNMNKLSESILSSVSLYNKIKVLKFHIKS